MKSFGAVTLANLPTLYTALLNPWTILGILMLHRILRQLSLCALLG